jgi:hypothetical protein
MFISLVSIVRTNSFVKASREEFTMACISLGFEMKKV